MVLLGEMFYINKNIERTKRVREQRKVEPDLAWHYTDDISVIQKEFKNKVEKAMTIDKEMLTMMAVPIG